MTAGLIRLAELARRSEVPAATIKHYVREGLLPGPAKKTGKTMAYYDASLVSRVRAIKELQRKRYLPLPVIKQVLDGADPYRSEETERALEQALSDPSEPEQRTRAELLADGMPSEQLDFFESVGFVTPQGTGDDRCYRGDDLALLRTLAAARRAGLSPDMLPHTIVGPYVKAVQALVQIELQMFREGMRQSGEHDVQHLVRSAAQLSEQLVVLLRRKMLLPTLRKLAVEGVQQEGKA